MAMEEMIDMLEKTLLKAKAEAEELKKQKSAIVTKKTYKNFEGGLKTILEYSVLLLPPSKESSAQLFENIKRDGIMNPIIVDQNNIILDGHQRYKIAEQLDIDFETYIIYTHNIEEGKKWIVTNQLGRRSSSK